MSRHKLVKTMDLEDELDDFDGGNDYEYNNSAGGDGEDGEDHMLRNCLEPSEGLTNKQ